MKTKDLQEGKVYQYTANGENVSVKYAGRDNGGYGFWSYNEDSGNYDGYYNRLSELSVENQIGKR